MVAACGVIGERWGGVSDGVNGGVPWSAGPTSLITTNSPGPQGKVIQIQTRGAAANRHNYERDACAGMAKRIRWGPRTRNVQAGSAHSSVPLSC